MTENYIDRIIRYTHVMSLKPYLSLPLVAIGSHQNFSQHTLARCQQYHFIQKVVLLEPYQEQIQGYCDLLKTKVMHKNIIYPEPL